MAFPCSLSLEVLSFPVVFDSAPLRLSFCLFLPSNHLLVPLFLTSSPSILLPCVVSVSSDSHAPRYIPQFLAHLKRTHDAPTHSAPLHSAPLRLRRSGPLRSPPLFSAPFRSIESCLRSAISSHHEESRIWEGCSAPLLSAPFHSAPLRLLRLLRSDPLRSIPLSSAPLCSTESCLRSAISPHHKKSRVLLRVET